MEKKKKIILISAIVLAGVLVVVLLVLLLGGKDEKKPTVNVVDTIEEYGYTLNDNETQIYKDLFNELKEVLNGEINKSDYAKVVAKLFVADFYTLDNKLTKTDIGGIQFIHSDIKENFALKASDTFYKYLENNLDGKRTTKYPRVKEFSEESVEESTYKIEEEEVSAYQVTLTWNYDRETTYQNNAIIILVSEENKLSIVEIKKKEIEE